MHKRRKNITTDFEGVPDPDLGLVGLVLGQLAVRVRRAEGTQLGLPWDRGHAEEVPPEAVVALHVAQVGGAPVDVEPGKVPREAVAPGVPKESFKQDSSSLTGLRNTGG